MEKIIIPEQENWKFPEHKNIFKYTLAIAGRYYKFLTENEDTLKDVRQVACLVNVLCSKNHIPNDEAIRIANKELDNLAKELG